MFYSTRKFLAGNPTLGGQDFISVWEFQVETLKKQSVKFCGKKTLKFSNYTILFSSEWKKIKNFTF
jgi:hypothetical protein